MPKRLDDGPTGGVAAAERAAERAARVSYGRLVALLAARSRDIAGAEDALAEALRAALEHWPVTGVPDNPDAWLLTAARRVLSDAGRRQRTRDSARDTIDMLYRQLDANRLEREDTVVGDERLKLLFVCAHPAIDPKARTPLMLQTVLGLDAARIAAAFLTAPSTMGQRLVRAKAKIRDAGIPFAIPEADALPERLDAVMDAVYAAYGAGWQSLPGAEDHLRDLAGEAIYLGETLVALLPETPEPRGLLALMLHCEARRKARYGSDGTYIALDEQDTNLWSPELIRRAEQELRQAARHGQLGRFQLEAAIQSAHSQRCLSGLDTTPVIAQLYDLLVTVAGTVGAEVGRAAAHGRAFGAAAGLALLEVVAETATSYQPYWATRAHLLTEAGCLVEARACYDRAIALSEDPAIRAWLTARRG